MLEYLFRQQDFYCGVFNPNCQAEFAIYSQVLPQVFFFVAVASVGMVVFGTILTIKQKKTKRFRMSVSWAGVGMAIIASTIIGVGLNYFPLIITLFAIVVTLYFGEQYKPKKLT